MSNGSQQSVDRDQPTDSPVDVDRAREAQAKRKIREKVREKMEQAGEIIRKSYGPPGTP